MMLNLDFSKNVVIDTNKMDWISSPSEGVERKPLAGEEAESGPTTSILRFPPGSSYKYHQHPLGEELIVLDGVFSDENGDYGKGNYIRNPPGSGHRPFSKEGCLLFVKLDQFDQQDKKQFNINTENAEWLLSLIHI